jgi:glutamyl-tRNA synthetase
LLIADLLLEVGPIDDFSLNAFQSAISNQQSAIYNHSMPRVRFAPSPTGYLHIGGARTALFNWLYARRHGGAFVLRIEDTDTERSSWEMVSGILDGLRWLGLDWDEGPDVGGPHAPYFQSQRVEQYHAMAERLVSMNRAYYCYCTAETLQQKRQAAEAAGGGWVYDRTCCALSPHEIAAREASGAARAIRFKVPAGRTSFNDLVHGPIAFDNANIEDFVVLRSDGQPTYHLSVVTDDIDMEISHVVRGDDHISNTPKHVLLYEAFGAPLPEFAHVPLILGPDKKRLSKRHGAMSVMEYHRLGYLPEAMVNFLALLGWSPGDDRELMTRDELIAAFALEGISGGNAVFNPEKLDWFNQQYLMRLPVEEVARRVEPWLREGGLWTDDLKSSRQEWLHRLLELVRPRVKKMDQFANELRPFLAAALEFDQAAVAKHLAKPEISPAFRALPQTLDTANPFDSATLEPVLRQLAESAGVKAAALIHATRVAVTGRSVSPGLFDVLELLGRDRVIARLHDAQKFLTK